jgi:hypothetical protein
MEEPSEHVERKGVQASSGHQCILYDRVNYKDYICLLPFCFYYKLSGAPFKRYTHVSYL